MPTLHYPTSFSNWTVHILSNVFSRFWKMLFGPKLLIMYSMYFIRVVHSYDDMFQFDLLSCSCMIYIYECVCKCLLMTNVWYANMFPDTWLCMHLYAMLAQFTWHTRSCIGGEPRPLLPSGVCHSCPWDCWWQTQRLRQLGRVPGQSTCV